MFLSVKTRCFSNACNRLLNLLETSDARVQAELCMGTGGTSGWPVSALWQGRPGPQSPTGLKGGTDRESQSGPLEPPPHWGLASSQLPIPCPWAAISRQRRDHGRAQHEDLAKYLDLAPLLLQLLKLALGRGDLLPGNLHSSFQLVLRHPIRGQASKEGWVTPPPPSTWILGTLPRRAWSESQAGL